MWCLGFREIRWVQPERIGKGAMPPKVRECVDLGLEQLKRVLAVRVPLDFPAGTAGPCGTRVCAPPTPGALLAWSMQALLPHLAKYYAALPKHPYPKLGAKADRGGTLFYPRHLQEDEPV